MVNHNEWMLMFHMSFVTVSLFLLDMFIGVMGYTCHDKGNWPRRRETTRGAGEERGDRKGSQPQTHLPFPCVII